MANLIEQARGSLSFHDLGIGSSYSESVTNVISRQRRKELSPGEVAEPFEQLFVHKGFVPDKTSGTRTSTWIVPMQGIYQPSCYEVVLQIPYSMPMTYGPWDVLKLDLVDTVSNEVIDMSGNANQGKNVHKTICYPTGRPEDINKFNSNPPSGSMTVGYPDNFSALYCIGHERAHIDDPAFKNPVLASALVKKVAIEMLNGKKLIHFMGKKPEEIEMTLRTLTVDYTNIAGKSVNTLLAEPLTPQECQALLASEETAAHGGVDYLIGLAEFMRFTSSQIESLRQGAVLYAVDALASYISFTRKYVGKSFNDVSAEMRS